MLKNLKSIFIIEEEKPRKPAETVPNKTSVVDKTTTTQKSVPASTTTAGTREGKVTSKFTDILLGAMEKANMEGFDYLEYKKSLQSLQKMNMVEATAYQSAFAMAQTMGASPEKLINSAQHYLQALKVEEEKFAGALANQQQSRIGAKKEEQTQLQQTIKNKEAQIQQLQKEIQDHQAKLGKLDKEIGDAMSSSRCRKDEGSSQIVRHHY
jgi:cell division protein FtsB